MPQELYRWGASMSAGKAALELRYRLLPQLYTLMHAAHTTGSTVHNALWMHFPGDAVAAKRDAQFMWGDSLLFTPVLADQAREVEGYFPQGTWYPLVDEEDPVRGEIVKSAVGVWKTIPTPLEVTNVHLRGGAIIPMQESAMTTAKARSTPFTLSVALDESLQAKGHLFLDDGEQIDLKLFRLVTFSATGTTLEGKVADAVGEDFEATANLGYVEVRGLATHGGDSLRGRALTCSASVRAPSKVRGARGMVAKVAAVHAASADKLTLDLTALRIDIAADFTVDWSCA